jgi:hypothetical protein
MSYSPEMKCDAKRKAVKISVLNEAQLSINNYEEFREKSCYFREKTYNNA